MSSGSASAELFISKGQTDEGRPPLYAWPERWPSPKVTSHVPSEDACLSEAEILVTSATELRIT